MSALAEDMMAALCDQGLLCLFAERASLVAYSMCARRDTFSHREHWPVSGLLHTSAHVRRRRPREVTERDVAVATCKPLIVILA